MPFLTNGRKVYHRYKKCQVMESIFCESLEWRLYIGGSDWALKKNSISISNTHLYSPVERKPDVFKKMTTLQRLAVEIRTN